ncbi:MAG: histidine phosphatase family protein [Clostridiales bacterium]|nr:histidine phosphatase family protein [Clostridiales bacterium]HOA84554.1 histidine phosphatase family protein [Bacillota bacterium]
MIVYLIRHGQTESNRDKVVQGWSSVGLTEKGIKQAESLKGYFAEKKLDRIICSDLYRARQTCSIVFEGRENIEYDVRLRELNNTVLMGQRRDDLVKIYGDEFLDNAYRLNYTAYGGESSESLIARAASFLSDLEKDTKSNTVAVLTHGGVIFAILHVILQIKLYTPMLSIDNCSLTKLRFKDGLWTVMYINNKIRTDGTAE